MVKVSIIVPVYNCSKFLRRCLDSLINQTLTDIEIICINDGSTDNSEEIIKSYKDERIKLISKHSEGPSIARNIGIEQSKGEYVGFVDSDDWVDKNFFEKLYFTAQKYNADIATAGIIRLHKFNKKTYLKFNKETYTTDFQEKIILCDLPDKSYVWNKIYRLSSFKENGLTFEEGRYYEDVVFTPQALYKIKSMVTVPNIYYYYWRSSGSIVTLRNEKANTDSEWAHKKAEAFLTEHNIDISMFKTYTKRIKFLGFSIFKIVTKGNKKSYRLFNIIKWDA